MELDSKQERSDSSEDDGFDRDNPCTIKKITTAILTRIMKSRTDKTCLDLSNSGESIAPGYWNLSSEVRWEQEDINVIAKFLSRNSKITHLSLHADDVVELDITKIVQIKTLKKLTLDGIQPEPEEIDFTNSEIETLSIDPFGITSDFFDSLEHSNITHLELITTGCSLSNIMKILKMQKLEQLEIENSIGSLVACEARDAVILTSELLAFLQDTYDVILTDPRIASMPETPGKCQLTLTPPERHEEAYVNLQKYEAVKKHGFSEALAAIQIVAAAKHNISIEHKRNISSNSSSASSSSSSSSRPFLPPIPSSSPSSLSLSSLSNATCSSLTSSSSSSLFSSSSSSEQHRNPKRKREEPNSTLETASQSSSSSSSSSSLPEESPNNNKRHKPDDGGGVSFSNS